MKYRIQFVISGLGGGGAERMLLKLLTALDRSVFVPEVVSLTEHGTLTVDMCRQMNAIDVPVHLLGMRHGVPDPRGVVRLAGWLRQRRPHLVNTWMYHADLIGGVAAKLAGNIPVVWNLRHSNLDPAFNKKTTLWAVKTCAHLSRWLPSRIICCAEAARQAHARIGYHAPGMTVIPNGFDLSAFQPLPQAKAALCQELGLPPDTLLVGLVARFDPLKDHSNFIQAAALLRARLKPVRFVLCGDGITEDNAGLAAVIAAAGVRDAVHLLGHRTDVPHLNAAFDVATSSSSGEGFSNTIGEAMACGVPCVVTDVGDSALIVGDTGRVVPARNAAALAGAWYELLNLPDGARRQLGQQARLRVQGQFSLERVARQYENLFHAVLATPRAD